MNVIRLAVMESAIDDPSLSLGVARLSLEGEVRYVNRAARSMSGGEFRVGRNISEFDFDPRSSAELSAALQKRFGDAGGSSYRVSIQRPEAGPKVHLHISAVPEFDGAGKLVGSVGFFTDESVGVVSSSIHKVIQDAWDSDQLLRDVTRLIRDIVKFDTLIVTGINREKKIMRRLFEEPPPPPEVVPTTWWYMRPFIEQMIDPLHTGPLDLEAFFATPEFELFAREDPTVAQFKQRGFLRSLVLGVSYRGKLCATVSLLRKEAVDFTAEDYDRCVRLPIGEAVNTAIRFKVQRDQQFGARFVQSIAEVADDPRKIGQLLVDQLQQHHEWEHVSLFRIDSEGTRLDLVSQAGSRLFPANYSQPVTVGLLGRAFTKKEDLNVDDVRDAGFADDFHPALQGTLSELVLRVPGTEGRWLLNIESSSRAAFADDEQEAVCVQLRVAGFILKNVASVELNSAIVRCVDDAVIQTNELGVIVEANGAASRLLDYSYDELLHRNLSGLLHLDSDQELEDEETAGESETPWQRADTSVAGHEPMCVLARAVKSPQPLPLKLRRKDGSAVPVLLSGAELPAQLGRVFIAGDMRTQNRIERMQIFTNLFRQIASEIRVPLALADSFLGSALALPPGKLKESQARELIDKSMRQIRKADVPLETVARFCVQGSDRLVATGQFDIRDALEELIGELPAHDSARTEVQIGLENTLIRAPRHELLFCVRTLMAYLLRHGAEVEKVILSLASRASRMMLSLALRPTEQGTVTEPVAEQAEFDFALTEQVIEDLMERMGGSSSVDSQRRRFRLFFSHGA
jgi:PAS domain-containing protein